MTRRTALVALALLGACAPQATPIAHGGDGKPAATPQEPIKAPPTKDQGGMPSSPYVAAPDEDVAALVAANNAFAADLYGQLRQKDGNVAASPASIALAFGMTYAGAEGRTAQQLHDTLRVSLDDDRLHRAYGTLLRRWNSTAERPYELRVANRLFGEKSIEFEPPFVAVTGDHYEAELEEMDFLHHSESARQHINSWVEDQTQERIKGLLPEGVITSETKLVLANAIYFKGKWAKQFSKRATMPAEFHSAAGAKQTPMMQLTSKLAYGHVDGVQLLTMGYQGGDLAMTVMLPDARDGLADLEAKITAESLERWFKSTGTREVVVRLPRFTIDPPKPISLNDMMQKLGVTDAFEPGEASFVGMSREAMRYRLHITDAVHKAFVEVNEEGTEAAAATGVVIGSKFTSVQLPPVAFTADHPFVFVIRDTRSGAVLFIGRVAEPASV